MLQPLYRSCRRWYGTIGRANVNWLHRVKLFDDDHLDGVDLIGWLRSIRRQKKKTFLSVDDGSSATPLQIVMSTNEVPTNITIGSCVRASGSLHASPGEGQSIELHGKELTILGRNPSELHPLGDGRYVENATARQFLHLRPRLTSISALWRLRHRLETAIRRSYDSAGYFHVHTPLLTSVDCEGAGETLTVRDGETFFHSHRQIDGATDDKKRGSVHLTVSSQLHLEAAMSGLGHVYTLSPAWRGEKSHTRHHLVEFYMLEAESIDLSNQNAICYHVEQILRHIANGFFKDSDNTIADLIHLDENMKSMGKETNAYDTSINRIQRFIETPFSRMTFNEALKILLNNSARFKDSVITEETTDFGKEHERFLSHYVGDKPLFITDFPASAKPFYCELSSDGSTARAVDLILPNVGEVMGGSVREADFDVLKERLKTDNGDQFISNMQWYLDLRKFGGPPHGGYGVGFDRLLQFFVGLSNIRDVVPFPRFYGSCKL